METEGLTEEEIARNEQIAILTDRVERAANNERDVVTETMDVYPVLPLTSLMHFCTPPDERTLFEGFEDTLVAWTRPTAFHMDWDNTAPRYPVYINAPEVLMLTCLNLRMCHVQRDFCDLVIRNPDKDVLAYWHNRAPIASTIDLLARRTANAVVITRHPRQDSQQHFSYEDITNPGSRLFTFVKDMVVGEHGPLEDGEETPVCTVYLIAYRPVDVLTVRLKFPRTRIVGITTPEPTDDAQMLKVLKTLNAVSMSGKRNASKEASK